MIIADQCAVSFHYTLTDDAGAVIDSSEGHEPLAYLHGMGNIVPGLESAMSGKKVGDAFSVRVIPEDTYALPDERLIRKATRAQFPPNVTLVEGMRFTAQSAQGAMPVKVVKVEGDDITLDGNHELAGVALNFAVQVVSVRAATAEELDHGHVHGEGGHHH